MPSLMVARLRDRYSASRIGIMPSVVSSSSLGCHSVESSWMTGGMSGEFPCRVHPGFDRVELRLQRALGGLLHLEVERRIDAQAPLVQIATEAGVELGGPQPLDEVRRHVAVIRTVRREHERVCLP